MQPLAPFISEDLDRAILGAAMGDGVVLTINGTPGMWHHHLSPGMTKFDFTIENGGQIVFGARPANADVILISYNFNSWRQINTGDSWSPYTVAWTADENGVPEPLDPAADAYDLIAIAKFDLNGDGVYGTECDYEEMAASEGNYLILDDQDRPELVLYGLAYNDFVEPFDYLDWNWPGNPLFRSGDELQGPNYENKLSGIESDVFVVASDANGGNSDIASVTLDITSTELAGAPAALTHIDMTEYRDRFDIDIPITLYEADFRSGCRVGSPRCRAASKT
ncbi:MAG: hypothetical protein MZV65_29020 [Chromatiales bacterium]|nr:hypothetical protein [Chromatiales bacterium]